MSTTVPDNNYPFAGPKDGYIPFDLGRPYASREVSLWAGDSQVIAMPQDVNVVMIVGSAPFRIVDSDSPVVQDGWNLRSFEAGAEIYYNMVVGSNIILQAGDEDTQIVVNCMTIWGSSKNIGSFRQS